MGLESGVGFERPLIVAEPLFECREIATVEQGPEFKLVGPRL
jgi:hypothetical protein